MQLCNTLVLTYRIDYNEYTGGAHGIYMSTFLNLDLKTLSPIRLDDLFEGDYKEALTDLLWKQLMADNNVSTRQELEDMGYATTGDLEPIENFYLDPTGITFYYNVYEIAPYVMGATKITLSYEDIAPLMNGKFIVLSSAIKQTANRNCNQLSINIKFTMDLILKYFPDLTEEQKRQFAALYDLYLDWNSKINVISRKDIENLYEHHVLHSLGIAKVIRFRPGTQIMDLGTGGGFPGIPLAILFPEVQFHLVDSIGKKVRVASEIANSIGLKNITFRHARAEEEKGKFDFVVSRAVMPLTDLLKIIRKNISSKQQNALPNGLICLKGGELGNETMPVKNKTTLWDLKEFFEEEFFETKKVVYVGG